MQWKWLLIFFLLLFPVTAGAVPLEDAIYSDEYYLSTYPNYPPQIGDNVTLRLRTFNPAQKVTLYSDRYREIPMVYREGYWWGKFEIPEDYKEGSHFFYVWIRYPFKPQPRIGFLPGLADYFGFKRKLSSSFWSNSLVWYQIVKKSERSVNIPSEMTLDAEGIFPIVTGEAVEIKSISPEASPFIIKGSKTMTFSSRNIEGTKEGFVPGVTREEALRLNISGRTDGVEVDANMISTSTTGTSQISQRDEKISVLLKRGSTEAYLGDFNADFNETEFTRLNKMLSGFRLKGDYERWGFNALYSSPKGESKFKRMYGDGTQGPFKLDAAPVVINSENIYLDGALQKRGDDYTIDYQAGTVTFLKKTIDPKSVLNINYDYSQTVYQHSTYGLRLTSRPRQNLKAGVTYLNDSDSLSGAEEIRQNMAVNPVDPQSHFVVGADGSYVSDTMTLMGEAAYSSKSLNLLSTSATEETGKAIKLDLGTQLGPFGISAHGKGISAKFQPIADPNPKQDLREYGYGLSFRPNSLFGAKGDYDYEKYTQSGTVYENNYQTAKAGLTPDKWPSLEYNFSENKESNDPVTGDTISRTITRNSAETIYRLGFLSTSLKGTTEKWLRRSPSEEVTDYRRMNLGLATVGIEKLTFTSNVELEDREEPTGAKPYRKTYNLNLSAAPSKQYFISTSLEYLDDSVQGQKNVTDLSYRAEPNEVVRTDGKYTIASVNEDYATTEAVSKQSGSFSLDLRPFRYLRARYLFKPNFTRILRTDTISYNNEQQQAEINLIPLNELLLGMLYKQGRSFNISKQDYSLKQNSADTDSALYTLKMAPLPIFSIEFNYLLENGRTTALVTAEPAAYLPGKSFNKKIDAMVKTSLSEKFSVDSRYTYQRSTQGSGEASSNLADSASHTASLKGIWNFSDAWSFSITGAYSKATNNLAADPVSYTVSPGCGIIYRNGDKFRVDFDYLYSRSYAGLTTEKSNYSLRAKYSLSDYVNVVFRSEQEISRAPDYKLTDITGNIEINL
jgi:hypothetical protein